MWICLLSRILPSYWNRQGTIVMFLLCYRVLGRHYTWPLIYSKKNSSTRMSHFGRISIQWFCFPDSMSISTMILWNFVSNFGDYDMICLKLLFNQFWCQTSLLGYRVFLIYTCLISILFCRTMYSIFFIPLSFNYLVLS